MQHSLRKCFVFLRGDYTFHAELVYMGLSDSSIDSALNWAFYLSCYIKVLVLYIFCLYSLGNGLCIYLLDMYCVHHHSHTYGRMVIHSSSASLSSSAALSSFSLLSHPFATHVYFVSAVYFFCLPIYVLLGRCTPYMVVI